MCIRDSSKDNINRIYSVYCLQSCPSGNTASHEALKYLHLIFTDNKEIRNQLGVWKSKCRKDIPSEEQYREQCKLLELMANDLGYKDKITWDIIQNPYYPEGLNQQLTMNTQIMNGQVEWAKAAGLLSQMMGKPQQNSEDTDHANT